MDVTPLPRAPGRPVDPAIDEGLLHATQDLLIKEGFERLTMDAVARRCGASKATIYRRWPSKIALVVAAAAALFIPPELPDTGDLREDLLACARAYVQHGRYAQVLAVVLAAAQHDAVLRDAAREAIGVPFSGLFDEVLTRAVERGWVADTVDVAIVAEIFPAIAYERVAARGLVLTEGDVVRVVDSALLPALGLDAPEPGRTHGPRATPR